MKKFFGTSQRIRREADLFFADLTGEPPPRPPTPPRPAPQVLSPQIPVESRLDEQENTLANAEAGEAEEPTPAEEPTTAAEIVLVGAETLESEEGPKRSPALIDSIPMLGRILWPALGFPAVVTPSADPRKEPSLEVDATRCLTLLVLTNRPTLTSEEAAKSLRIVPWSQRSRRFLAENQPGAFSANDLLVRTDSPATRLTLQQPKGATEQLIAFGGGKGGERTMLVNLSSKVREIYRGWGLEFLHEIRVSEAVTAKLAEGTYHFFFNNLRTTENAPSDEMTLLIRRLAMPRRMDELVPRMQTWLPDPLKEYEYEYGSIYEPYKQKRPQQRRVDVLHPVFVRKSRPALLRIGHITDLHVDVRSDVYEYNLNRNKEKEKDKDKLKVLQTLSFSNWNESVRQIYEFARLNADALLLTGDLIDYGRGHVGIGAYGFLGKNEFYHRDRNWLLFYDMLVGDDDAALAKDRKHRYAVPVYTSLGNHDWRINPYPPFAAAGAPGVSTLINDYDCFSDDQLRDILRTAHGDGHELSYSYDPKWKVIDLVDIVKTIGVSLTQASQLDDPGLPTETSIDSVIWYLLTINPFFDYMWAWPSGHRLLMLDWVKDEAVLFPTIDKGKEYPYLPTPSGLSEASDAGPKAIRALSDVQKRMVEDFVKLRDPAKIIGIHVPPIGPWWDWGDDDLKMGFKRYRKRRTRGPVNYALKKDGKVTELNGHPMFAFDPKRGPDGNTLGMSADYNSFMRHREWFIRTLADRSSGVRIVLSGHIHRNGLFGVRVGTRSDGEILEGEYLVQSLDFKEIRGTRSPNISTRTTSLRAPLYVNTTSAGPRGNVYPAEGQHLNTDPGYAQVEMMADGMIRGVDFRRPVHMKKASCDVGKARNEKGLPAFAF